MKRNSSKPKRRYGDAGFTLVELVVVIAVLAILAGVGAVAYNGYIDYANKGNDRALVGEIIHALELADYANPELFGENGGAMVILTTNGVQVAGGLEGSDLKGALEDAFGDLKSATLSYDKWDGTPDMSVFKDLRNSKAIKAYVDAGKTASFANNIDDLWDTIQGYTDGSLAQFSGQDYLAKAVESFSQWDDSKAVQFQNMWREGDFSSANVGSRALAATAARNYSFYSYAKSQNLEPDMLSELDTFKNSLVDFAAGPFDSSTVKSTYFSGHNNEWAKIMSDYNENQGATDALAFLGMIDAAGEVGKNLEATVHDNDADKDYASNDAYKEAMSKYLGMVSNVLSGRVNYKEIADLAEKVNGNAVVISVTKANGKLDFDVNPKPANPREDGSSSGSGSGGSPEEIYDTTLTVEMAASSYELTPAKKEITIKNGTSCTISIINASTHATINKAPTVSGGDGFVTTSTESGTITVTGTSVGTATLTIWVKANVTTTITVRVE